MDDRMNFAFQKTRYKISHWLYYNIGELSESSLKYKSSILLISVIIIFTSPDASLTFGSASFVGLGISVTPPQTIPIGPFLLALLAYRFISFWIEVIIDNGLDEKRTARKIEDKFTSSHYESNYFDDSPDSEEEYIEQQINNKIHSWKINKIIWNIAPPNIAAIACITKYLYHHLA